jgi:hypothetical protein
VQYDLVFDVGQKTFEWEGPLIGFVFVAIGLVMWRSERSAPANARKAKTSLFTRFFLGFSIFWTVSVTGGTLVSYRTAHTAIEEGRYSEVEGVVENFDPMPYGGHKDESFTVRGRKFTYSDYKITPYFGQTASHGGPIRAGLQVRIRHLGGNILRLEVEHGAAAAPGVVIPNPPPTASLEHPRPWIVLLMLAFGWPLVTATLAILSGWRRLAERFPAPPIVDGEKYASQSLRLSLLGSYNRCVHVTVGEKGLHMVPMILFRLLHPPILIPWTDISACERRDFLFMKRTRITVGTPLGREIDVSGRVAPAIELAWRSRNTGIGQRSG